VATLLIIEDAVDLARGIARELQANGYTVDLAHCGPDGLATFQSTQPDLVILDWMLPGLDGLEVLRRLRQSSAVPVLMLTTCLWIGLAGGVMVALAGMWDVTRQEVF
jgi:DNA-binding response OmpR family regulator